MEGPDWDTHGNGIVQPESGAEEAESAAEEDREVTFRAFSAYMRPL